MKMKDNADNKNYSDRFIVNLANDLYGKHTLKADACRHILAAAYYTTKYGPFIAKSGGFLVEILGSVKAMIKLKGFSSGWLMDIRNNEIGIEMGKQYKKAGFNELLEKTKIILHEGAFYMPTGRMAKDEQNNS